MAITSNRTTSLVFTEDQEGAHNIEAAANIASPGSITIHTLSSGFNQITVPTAGTVPTAATIVPPFGNEQTLTLKGVTGDTGIALHITDPSTLALASSVTSFGITAGGTVTGLRIFWS